MLIIMERFSTLKSFFLQTLAIINIQMQAMLLNREGQRYAGQKSAFLFSCQPHASRHLIHQDDITGMGSEEVPSPAHH